MTDGVFHGPAFIVAARRTRTWPLFLALISLATLLPFALAPLVGHVFPADSPAIGVYAVLTFLASNFHVALTGWFYTDRDMRGHFRSKPVRYLIVPGAIVAINVIAFCFLDSAIRLSIVFIFICWLLWHYQKQNVGLLSFIAAGTDRVPLSAWERRTLALSAIAGISGCFSLMHFGPANLSTVFAQFHQVGAAIYLVLVPLSFSIALIRNPILRTNPLRLVFFVIGTLFFLPTYIFSELSVRARRIYAGARPAILRVHEFRQHRQGTNDGRVCQAMRHCAVRRDSPGPRPGGTDMAGGALCRRDLWSVHRPRDEPLRSRRGDLAPS